MNNNKMISNIEDICRQSGSKKIEVIENGEIKGTGEHEIDLYNICGKLEITNTGKNMLLSGSVKASAKAICSRCLEEFSLDLSSEITEKFFKKDSSFISNKKDKRQKEKSGSKEDEFSYSGFKLDMTEAIRQNLVVNIPFAAVCSDDCKGLCPECGANLNNGQCSCHD